MKVKELIELLEADGWYQVRMKSSPISSSDEEGNRDGRRKAER